jgi:hypothetical protein
MSQTDLFDLIEPSDSPARAHPAPPSRPPQSAAQRPARTAKPAQAGLFEEPARLAANRQAPKKARFRPGSPRGHAQAIAEACADAWWRSYGASSLEVPFGTVAAATLISGNSKLLGSRDPDTHLQSLTRDQAYGLLQQVWGELWLVRPDLTDAASPIHSWATGERRPSDGELDGVRAVFAAASRYGVFEYTAGVGTEEPYVPAREADLFGILTQIMRSAGDREARGEYYTPPEVCDMMARMIMPDGAQPGESICDPASGTGGMIRAAAAWMRELRQDPAQAHWYMNDIVWSTAGLAAVNAYLWDLGPNVFIGHVDALADASWPQAAAERTVGAWRHRDRILEAAAPLALLARLEQILDTAEPEN